jgi:hypothetical protein
MTADLLSFPVAAVYDRRSLYPSAVTDRRYSKSSLARASASSIFDAS